MKRRVERPAPDYGAHRPRWADLVALARRAVSTETGADLDALAVKALDADSCWTPAAPYPDGLVCRALSRLAWVYGRQARAERRAGLKPLVTAAADLVEALLNELDQTPAPAPVEAGSGAVPAARLPYSDA